MKKIFEGEPLGKKKKKKETFIGEICICKSLCQQTAEVLGNIIFSAENKFNIFGSDNKKTMWRKPNAWFKFEINMVLVI